MSADTVTCPVLPGLLRSFASFLNLVDNNRSMESNHSCLWYLRNIDFFPKLSETQMQDLAERSEMRHLPKRASITPNELIARSVYLIKEGRIRTLEQVTSQRRIGTDILGPGDMVGISDYFAESGDTEYYEAIEDAVLCVVEFEVLQDILKGSQELTLHVAKRVGIRMRRIESRLLDLMFCTVPVRVSRTLLELIGRFGRQHRSGTIIDLALTHQQYADLVGSNREATTRALTTLQDCGAIGYEGKKIVVRDLATLTKLAER